MTYDIYTMESEPVLIDNYETEDGTVRLYSNGLVESVISEGAYIDVPYLLEGKARLKRLLPGKKFYVISMGNGFFRISKEARRLSASKEYSDHIAAVAVITSHVSVRYILELYLKIDKPVSPTKTFTGKQKAVQWLTERMKTDGI